MTMQCPFCESHQIQRYSVVRAAGTHNIQVNHIGTVDGQFAQGYSHGTQYSALAQYCAPPAPPSPMPFVVAYGSGGVVTYLALTTCDMFERGCRYGMSAMALLVYNWKQVAVGLCLIALGWLLFNGWRYQAQTYHTEKRQWQNTWFCHGCGQSHTRS